MNASTATPQKTIFIDVPCPVSMRNVVTGPQSVVSRMQNMGYNVILLVPHYAVQQVAAAFPFQVESVNSNFPLTTRHKFSDFITKHLNLTRMQILGSKYGLRSNLDAKTRHAYLHILRIIIANTLGKSGFFRRSIAPKLHMWAFKDRPMQTVFDTYKPDLVFIPNMGAPQGEETIRECMRQGVPMIGMVGSWDHPHKRFQVVQPTEIFVWSDSLKEEMVTLQSHDPKGILVVGAPHLDMFRDPSFILSREEFFSRMGLKPGQKLFTLVSGAGRAPDEGDIIDMLLKWNDAGKTAAPIAVHIRTYPGDHTAHQTFDMFETHDDVDINWFKNGKEFGPLPINYFPDVAYMQDFVSLFYHSTAVMSVYSSASVEASVFERPSINISFDGYKERPFEQSVKRFVLQSHFDKLFKTGAVLEADSAQALLASVNTAISDPTYNRDNILKLQKSVCGVTDGKASERIATHLAQRLEEMCSKTSATTLTN